MAGTAKSKKQAQQKREEQRGIWREVLGVALIGVGLTFLYFLIADNSDGVGYDVRRFVRGLAGSLGVLLPVLCGWAGTLVIFSGRERSMKPGRIALLASLFLLLFTAVQIFSTERVIGTMHVYNYANFLAMSYEYGQGGGAIGALLAWPLMWTLGFGEAFSIIFLALLALSDLILLRKISLRKVGAKVGVKVREGYDGYREHYTQRAAERAAQRVEKRTVPAEVEDEFEAFLQDKKPVRQAAASRPKRVREMQIDRVEPLNALPGEPKVEPIEELNEEEPFVDDVPDFLSGDKRKKKKKDMGLEPLNVAEPEPLRKREPRKRPEPVPPAPEPEPVPEEDEPPLETADPLDDFLFGDPLELGSEDMTVEPPPAPPLKAEPEPAPVAPRVRAKALEIPSVEPTLEEYNYPPIDLLAASKPSKIANQSSLDENKARKLLETLESFGISARLIGIAHGPTVTRFELSPAPGIKVSRITSLADDIALNLAAISVRIEAPIPGKAAVGVEVPNDEIETVPLRDVLESSEARKHPSRIAAAFGRDNAGRYIVADLAKMPHVLIAGATGSGKSVCINCIICSILYRATPEEVRLIMIDPKVVELSSYNGIPHLLVPVVTDPKKAAGALTWAVNEMSVRYKKFADLGVRDMKGYNQHRPEELPPMPQIVIIIDELADLMMVTPGEVEDAICRLAQLARAAGIHLVIATQRPSVNVITGVIKANIPSRIAFTVASQVDSRTILDIGGAEKLLGRGDMLFAPAGTNKPTRVQGAWVSDDEVHEIVEYIKVRHDASYDEDIIEHMNQNDASDAEKEEEHSEYDELLPQAVEIVVEAGQASISMLQRKLRVGYARAGRLIDEMSTRGIVSEAEGAKPRNVLITREQIHLLFDE